jgi:phage-related protein
MGGGTGCPVGVGRGQFVTRRPSYVDRAVLYEYLYTAGADFATLQVVTDGSPPDVVFEGNSREVIRSFPKDIRSELGADLDRVQNGEKPLDSAPMAPVLPGVFELRDEDPDFWYRVLYKQIDGAVYVLHCFRKKTNKTSLNDIKIARERLSALRKGLAEQKKKKS